MPVNESSGGINSIVNNITSHGLTEDQRKRINDLITNEKLINLDVDAYIEIMYAHITNNIQLNNYHLKIVCSHIIEISEIPDHSSNDYVVIARGLLGNGIDKSECTSPDDSRNEYLEELGLAMPSSEDFTLLLGEASRT